MDSPEISTFNGRHVHFVGIGGAGMNGLARILLDDGATVTGSDRQANEQIDDLVARGVRVDVEQDGRLITSDTALVVRTAAVRDDNAEMTAAASVGVRTMKYAELLGQVMAGRYGVAVAGTHGKSTTSAMLSFAMVEAGLDPSFVIGGNVRQLGGGSRSGRGPHFVAEACEYDRSFLNLRPRVAVINNIEADHLDCYGSLESLIGTFRSFARLVPDQVGLVIANGDDANVRSMLQGIERRVETFGFEAQNDWRITPTVVSGGCHHGDLYRNGQRVLTLRPAIPGRHNLLNATCAVATAAACGADLERVSDAISRFTGVDRRMSEVGQYHGATLVDDYGHHPTEVRVTLGAIRQKYRPQRLICVFQPHQYSRTRLLLEEFASSFADADLTIVPEIYSVRDSADDRAAVSSATLVDRINRHFADSATHVPTFSEVIARLQRDARAGDVIVSMGAGNVCDITRELAAINASEGTAAVQTA